ELRAIVIRLNSSLPAKFGNRFMFFDMAGLSHVSECNLMVDSPGNQKLRYIVGILESLVKRGFRN
ncbi:hypothetical protein KJ656_17615, partial [bacterium]|nr:hypothetical protein [bacterium]